MDAPLFAQSRGIEDADVGGAVAHVDVGAVSRKSPAFACVGEVAEAAEVGKVVDKSDLRLPGKLKDFMLDDGDAFAEVLRIEIDALKNFSGLNAYFAKRGASFKASSFVEKAGIVDEPLGEGFGVVWEGLNDLEGVLDGMFGGMSRGLRGSGLCNATYRKRKDSQQ